MKLTYHADTDSLSIELCDRPSVDSREISEVVVLDYDAEGKLVGIDVGNAGNKIEWQNVLLSKLPGKVEIDQRKSLGRCVLTRCPPAMTPDNARLLGGGLRYCRAC